jgi:hypothetical protein
MEVGMNNKLLKCLTAGAMVATLALASPVLARGGGFGGGHGGGMHGGMGMHGGGMHVGGMGGGMRVGGMGGGMRVGGMGFAGSRVGFVGSRFAGPRFAHAGFVHHGRFFHHRHHRFAFIGIPYAYAAYDSCWRRTWTPYGLRWVNICGDYGYY